MNAWSCLQPASLFPLFMLLMAVWSFTVNAFPLAGLSVPGLTSASMAPAICWVAPCGVSTVIVKEHAAELSEASVAVHVTVVTPTGKLEPDAAEQFTTTLLQASLAVGAE
jgi:hypothetical protein